MDLLLFLIVFFVLAGMCLILERSKPILSLASKKNLTRQTRSLGNQTISFPGGGTIVIPPLSHERKNIPRPIFSKQRKAQTRSPTEVDGNYIPVIMDLLDEYFASYSQEVKVRVLENQIRILLQTILKWLCERNNLEVNTEFSLSQLLGHLYPFEKGIMQQWYAPLREWCDKFYSADEFHKHLTLNDAVEFGKFLLLFLHNIKNNSDLLMTHLNEKYPIRAPSPERETLAPLKAPEPKNPLSQHLIPAPTPPLSNPPKMQPPNNNMNKKPPLISENAICCPQCNALIPPSKTGRARCPQCSFCPSAIDLGYLLDEYGTVIGHFLYPLEAQRTHGIITGLSGWGKSKTALSMAQGYRERGVGALILQLSGHDFRRLRNMRVHTKNGIKDVFYFSPGKETCNIRINPLAIPQFNGKFASVTNHIDTFVAIFIFCYDLEDPFPAILGDATRRVYREKGWDLDKNEPPQGTADIFPRPIDLFSAVERELELGKGRYDAQTRKNLKDVLWTRLKNFNRDDLGKMFNCQKSLSFEDLLTKCVVFELEHLEDTNRLLITFLFLTSFFEYLRLKGEQSKLNHVVIIEESQKVLSKDTGAHWGNVMKLKTIEIITNAIQEFRKLGEGVILITQDPNRLDSALFTNSQTAFTFKLKDIDCIETMCNRFTKLRAKKDQIPDLKKGEGFVIVPDYLEAARVQFFEFPDKSTPLSDEEIIAYMHETYYKENPWALEAIDVVQNLAEIFGESMEKEVENPKDLYMDIKMVGVDKTAALIEYTHLISNPHPKNPYFLQGKRYPLEKCYKEVTEKKFRNPFIQPEIARIQRGFDEIGEIEDGKTKLNFQFFAQILNLATTNIPKPVPLPAVTYFLRILVFKYLKFTPPSKYALVYRLLIQLLAQNGFHLRS